MLGFVLLNSKLNNTSCGKLNLKPAVRTQPCSTATPSLLSWQLAGLVWRSVKGFKQGLYPPCLMLYSCVTRLIQQRDKACTDSSGPLEPLEEGTIMLVSETTTVLWSIRPHLAVTTYHQKCRQLVKQQQDWTLHSFHPCKTSATILKWKG